MKSTDCIEWFCSLVRSRLEELVKDEKYSEWFNPIYYLEEEGWLVRRKMIDKKLTGIELLDYGLLNNITMMECLLGCPQYNREIERKRLKNMDVIDCFCANLRNRLEILRKQGKHPELFEPVFCRK
jgi:hypothetical protein